MKRTFRLVGILFTVWLLSFGFLVDGVSAGELYQSLQKFPQWERLRSVKPANGDLIYPQWMEGKWLVTSTLVDLAAPLAPEITTPGFERNRDYLRQPVDFTVKFIASEVINLPTSKLIPQVKTSSSQIIADRAFNGLNLARAYLGDVVQAVKVDPQSPNRQITLLRSPCEQAKFCDRQLVSLVTARGTETISNNDFVATEVFQQQFSGIENPYFNIVESTTAYHRTGKLNPAITADQVTAVYLSPQDKNYFQASFRPVSLYRYHLDFQPEAG